MLCSLAHFNQPSVVVLIYTWANLLNNGSANWFAANESFISFPAATILAFSGNFQIPFTSLSKTILNAIPWILGSAFVISSKNTTWNLSGSFSHFSCNFLSHVGGTSIISPVDPLYTLLPFKLSGVALRRYIISQVGSICFTLADLPSDEGPCKNTATPLSIAPLIISSSLTCPNFKP